MKREESCRGENMHNENNDFMHERRNKGRQEGMYSCTFLYVWIRFDPTKIAVLVGRGKKGKNIDHSENRAKKKKRDTKLEVVDGGTMARLIGRIRCDHETFEWGGRFWRHSWLRVSVLRPFVMLLGERNTSRSWKYRDIKASKPAKRRKVEAGSTVHNCWSPSAYASCTVCRASSIL